MERILVKEINGNITRYMLKDIVKISFERADNFFNDNYEVFENGFDIDTIVIVIIFKNDNLVLFDTEKYEIEFD